MENGATLEAGFVIDPGESFATLTKLDDLIGSAAANAVREFAKVEAAAGRLNMGGATASMSAFGAATTKEAQAAARELQKVERAGEGLLRTLGQKIEVFGKTPEQVRALRVELVAAAADAKGLTDLAGNLRTTEAEMVRLEAAGGRVVPAPWRTPKRISPPQPPKRPAHRRNIRSRRSGTTPL